jgi:glutaminyl-tRNA synthetase
VRLYDRLFTVPDPDAREGDFKQYLNPDSLVVIPGALIEPSVNDDPAGSRYQFERVGYFCSDIVDSKPGALVFNRTVTLRDTWAKTTAQPAAAAPRAEKKPKAERAPKERGASTGGARPAGVMEVVRSPELEARRERYVSELGLSPADADVLTRDDELAGVFEATVGLGAAPKAVASWMVNVVLLEVKERGINELAFTPAELRELIGLVEDGTISSASGKAVLGEMVRGGGSPAEIVERRGLRQVSDPGALTPIVDQVIAANAAKADEYRAGKTGLLGFFVGQVMRQSGGSANPALVSQLVQERLGS